ncbi:DEHA2E09548p [Debaryomyces hansenii CBS767]|uniref:Probable kinetochore protein NDC80 n=1 Tax=Debaryomyces hansenii (strain ATCC 36239 / CBS 767 / BCRC 21394 / JCM 1990 / NBRC 0083 / IGC 2968) TaxID=284592 RepID=NDC80_DEBHA|nr:DEHA2E09548p [Debaryomyces hansenii CBS767]Q6BPZ9.2 RecName: Full=Probable kinetochore protein NDC80 [Debaryomyces hansenii CBS767]CAG87957.2 DEHA2E09548p [Debaryomyces hansenii CBS767]|eukprot:XP_459721.2 DEHA2E09548p [Debaryomyces hansenii CBS767]
MNVDYPMNNIPQASSLLRKNNGKRLSMASAARTSLLGNLNLNGTSGGASGRNSNIIDSSSLSMGNTGKRRSLLSTPASINRRRQSSLLQAPMSSSQMSSQSQQASQQTQAPFNQDQRPLRDKNYQTLIQQEIYDFLLANKFELEMNHPLTFKTLKQPTQKDFVVIFQFLYNKIDPYYRFTKSIETEVFLLLKILNYPYLDGINRSQISAVGGQNWPNFLGMLYWLVKLNLSVLNLNSKVDLISPDDEFDKIFINYITQSYRAFIDERDDYSEYYDEMKSRFDELNNNIIQDIENISNENNELLNQYNELNGQLDILENSEKKSKALENDLIKFKAYIETMESRKSKWSEILNKITQEIGNCEVELNNIESVKRDYEAQIGQQGLTPNDIDNLNTERDKLSKSIDLISNSLEDLKDVYHNKQINLQKNYQSLENFLKQYNNLIYKIQLKNHNYDYNFEINFRNNTIINETPDLLKPNEIINKNLKDEKIQLLNYKSIINTNVHMHQDEQIKLQEQIDLISELIMERREEIETLEAKLTANKSTYDEIYETMINDTTTYSMQIEKLERELRSIKINTNQGFIEVENKFQNIQIEYDELLYEIHSNRSILHDKIQKIIESTIGFKINIQSNLEDLENLAFDEFEKEDKKLNKN